jgi:hypothetical protein
MDINEFLKNSLNEETGHISKKGLKKIIPELKLIVQKKIKDREFKGIKREEMKIILQSSLREIGWNKQQISKLSKIPKSRVKNKQRTSPGFTDKKQDGTGVVTNPKFYQGGSPGLGKKKS